jgi:hypothetical protein
MIAGNDLRRDGAAAGAAARPSRLLSASFVMTRRNAVDQRQLSVNCRASGVTTPVLVSSSLPSRPLVDLRRCWRAFVYLLSPLFAADTARRSVGCRQQVVDRSVAVRPPTVLTTYYVAYVLQEMYSSATSKHD